MANINYNGLTGYNTNPLTQTGTGVYGAVPGSIGVAPSAFQQTTTNVPGLGGDTTGAANDIASELGGQLSPATMQLLQNKAASFGVNVGQPGGSPGQTITNSNLLDNLGLTSEGLTHQGIGDYNNTFGTVASTQTNPELATGVASRNATFAAAPNPTAAGSYAQTLFQQYLNRMSSPAGGTGVKPSTFFDKPTAGSAPSNTGPSYLTPGSTDWQSGYLPGPY